MFPHQDSTRIEWFNRPDTISVHIKFATNIISMASRHITEKEPFLFFCNPTNLARMRVISELS